MVILITDTYTVNGGLMSLVADEKTQKAMWVHSWLCTPLDNILAIQKVVHSINENWNSPSMMLLKVDIEKAYNSQLECYSCHPSSYEVSYNLDILD